jgi:hypothetical protein
MLEGGDSGSPHISGKTPTRWSGNSTFQVEVQFEFGNVIEYGFYNMISHRYQK